ncbi:MAG: regulatory protein RecX [Candidatus Eisenbacteria bacterium]
MIEAIRAHPLEAAREAALRLLEHTRRTRDDLTRRLRQRDFDAATIDAVLDRLAAVGLVDDVEYARAYLAERWGRRAAGWRRLEADLRRKGVAPADIATARERLERETGGADEVAMARRVVTQSARRMERLEPRVRRQRLWALLARRGFDGDVIEQALRESAPAVGADTGADRP